MAFFQAQLKERDRQIAEKKEQEKKLALKTPLPKKRRFKIVNPEGNIKLTPGIPGDKGFPQPPVKTIVRQELIRPYGEGGPVFYKEAYEEMIKKNDLISASPSEELLGFDDPDLI